MTRATAEERALWRHRCHLCGFEAPTKGRLESHLGSLRHARALAAATGIDDDAGPVVAELDEEDRADVVSVVDPEIEPLPQSPPSLPPSDTSGEEPAGKLRDLLSRPRRRERVPAERRAKGRRKRTDRLWSGLFGATGIALQRTGIDVPVGTCLQFQAPAIGPVMDRVIAGTVIDTVAQKVVGKGEDLEALGDFLALPGFVFLRGRNPAAAPVLDPVIRTLIERNIVHMAPVLRDRERRREQLKAAAADFGYPAGSDLVEAIFTDLFGQAPPEPFSGPGSDLGAEGGRPSRPGPVRAAQGAVA